MSLERHKFWLLSSLPQFYGPLSWGLTSTLFFPHIPLISGQWASLGNFGLGLSFMDWILFFLPFYSLTSSSLLALDILLCSLEDWRGGSDTFTILSKI
jgi:hypothetical protein